jgi:hypothetical protein
MADPVSFVAAGVGIADVGFRIVQHLKAVKASADALEEDIEALIAEIESLATVHGHLSQEF